jgi:hypothetical protein
VFLLGFNPSFGAIIALLSALSKISAFNTWVRHCFCTSMSGCRLSHEKFAQMAMPFLTLSRFEKTHFEADAFGSKKHFQTITFFY